ncbi:uncharacterized protein BDZ99DRAFT_499226 [Mytilinidion resinicola]|uniref:Uncharacterized protein n=1 Tax=Mytilinidion resinicola TaxID=574789 RepID=A0A6A6YLV4_9PEZI|nr:uncharacterized protein BDZ99DRAFT_499226 [Mytilinidion resinicola]KAF2808847.1 hypothetical protein BDZ99DRAFT_499226 [Mytilinidion resinicola]
MGSAGSSRGGQQANSLVHWNGPGDSTVLACLAAHPRDGVGQWIDMAPGPGRQGAGCRSRLAGRGGWEWCSVCRGRRAERSGLCGLYPATAARELATAWERRAGGRGAQRGGLQGNGWGALAKEGWATLQDIGRRALQDGSGEVVQCQRCFSSCPSRRERCRGIKQGPKPLAALRFRKVQRGRVGRLFRIDGAAAPASGVEAYHTGQRSHRLAWRSRGGGHRGRGAGGTGSPNQESLRSAHRGLAPARLRESRPWPKPAGFGYAPRRPFRHKRPSAPGRVACDALNTMRLSSTPADQHPHTRPQPPRPGSAGPAATAAMHREMPPRRQPLDDAPALPAAVRPRFHRAAGDLPSALPALAAAGAV